MEKQRVIVVVALLPFFILTNILGGIWFSGFVTIFVSIAAWEFGRLFKQKGAMPADILIVAGTAAICLSRFFFGITYDAILLPILILLSITWHLISYEKGREFAATDFVVTLSAILYVGFLGSFLLMLRQYPQGEWLVFTFFPAVWVADSGAYSIGKRIGKHKLAPRLSPKKSWEGYIAGLVSSLIFTPLLVLLFYRWGLSPETLSLTDALIIGAFMGVFPTLGDLGASMIKRQMGVKDSGNLLPGHGGMLDRIDSWLWMGALSYILIATGLI